MFWFKNIYTDSFPILRFSNRTRKSTFNFINQIKEAEFYNNNCSIATEMNHRTVTFFGFRCVFRVIVAVVYVPRSLDYVISLKSKRDVFQSRYIHTRPPKRSALNSSRSLRASCDLCL